MSFCEWIYWIAVEGIKVLLVGHYFFGYEWNKGKTRFLLLAYPMIALVIESLVDSSSTESFFIRNIGQYLLFMCLFKGMILEKTKSFLVIWFLVSLIDMVICVPFSLIIIIAENSTGMQMVIGCLGGLLLGILCWKAKSLQKFVQEFWKELSLREYVVLLFVLGLFSIVLGGMQGYLYDAITVSERKLTYILGMIAAVIFLLVYVLFLYTKRSKERLQEINQLNYRYMKLQRKYYENSVKQYEDMRRFRHDINNHLYILSELGREGRDAELKEYIKKMTENYDKAKGIHTGNFIADCIISHAVQELEVEENFSFQIDGHFPEKFPMEDIDFSILLSNLLNNAVEALEKEERKLLQIEVKRYDDCLYLIVANNTTKESIDFSHTSKQEANHGYGISNVRRVVVKYSGTAQWCVECGMVAVKVKLKL